MLNSWKEHYWHTVPCMRKRITDIVKLVNGKGKKVLETGCNEGFLSKALLEDGCFVTSVDIDEVNIKKTKELFNIDAVQADINLLPFVNEEFDIAVGGEILEHIDNPAKGFNELFRVAKEAVILSLPIGEYFLGEKTHKWWISAEMIEHDEGLVQVFDKHLLVIKFNKERERWLGQK